MAHVSAQKITGVSIGERISAFAFGYGKRVNDYRLYRRTLAELQSMNDRELADIGLHGSSLQQIARDAVYGTAK